jgi:hypothetical protein
MRLKTLLCLAALAAGAATSMAQSNVYSLNIVGYVTKTNVPGFALIANPLNTTNNNLSSLFSDAPSLTKIIRFVGGAYATSVFDPDDGWTPNVPLNPGEGAFIQVPAGPNYVKTYVGEVILNSTNNVPAGFSIRGSVIPQTGLVQTDLLYPAVNLDKVIKWTGVAYQTFVLDPDDGWTPSQPTIQVGESFFAQKGVSANWIRNFSVGP